MKAHRITQCVIYSLAGVGLGFVILTSIMVGVWGVRINPLLYLAFLSCIALLVGAVRSLFSVAQGRIIALFALAGIGTVWVPSTVSMVPQFNTVITPLDYLLFAGYFAVVAFALFFPSRWRFSTATFLLLCSLVLSIGGVTYVSRLRQGEYARPAFAYFHWRSDPADHLVVKDDSLGWIDSNARAILDRAGIHGTIRWSGSSGELTWPNHVILLAQARPTGTTQLYYPRHGVLIYAYDGSRWLKIPSDDLTFPLFSTLESDASSAMLYEEDGGIRQGTCAFTW